VIVGRITRAWPLKPVSYNKKSEPSTRWPIEGELTLSATVDQGFQALWVLRVDKVDERGVHPSPRLDRVEPANDEVELHVVIVAFVLDLPKIPTSQDQPRPFLCLECNVDSRGDLDTGNTFHDKLGRHSSFRLAHILRPSPPISASSPPPIG
jgi:hypothetical protein